MSFLRELETQAYRVDDEGLALNLITLALRNLRRRATRTIIVSLSVGLAVASALSLVALADSIKRSVGEGADERGADLTVLSRNASDIFSGFIAEDMKDKLSLIHGIQAVTGELVMYAPIDHDQQKVLTGWAADSFFWQRMPISNGHFPGLHEHRVVVLGSGAAEALHKDIGDNLDILDARFSVVGIANYQSALNRSMIYMPLPELQDIAFRQKQVTMFEIKLQPTVAPAEIEAIKAEVGQMDSLLATPTDQLLQHDRNLLVMKAISRSVSLIALTMGALSVLNALLMAVQERTREIGIMTAIGWSRARTMASIVFEGVLIGVAGCSVGIPLSYGISLLFGYLPTIGDILSFHPSLSMVLPTLLASIALCAVGSLYPAWRAASMSPADALRRP
jgi:putative ABC transport system permease protein